MVEALAVPNALRWARDAHFILVEILTDCLALVQGLQCSDHVDIFVKPIMVEIFEVVESFDYVAVTKVPRNVARPAHTSAKVYR
ncbi:hypothetical protein RHMOL_Rhmol11G0062900 [Rhododendron molle]|uniref:Uncharacterized protein n=1 Tax=Rhododendron molle TaxID=49168 RepID=A0ACC0LQ90_RHOML|nr:hypothetical protein RHMOL_Rhmol11G0062900 [Rhododendron molle]